jgi:hypothetical protein
MKKTPYLFFIGTLILLLSIGSCTKEKTITLPTLTTSIISSVTTISAQSGGIISNDGGATITVCGVCWSTSSFPTTSNSKTSDIKDTTTFTSSLTGLLANTTYYVRAYATNSTGTAYGNEISFTTNQASLVGTWGSYGASTTVLITFFDDSHFEFIQINGNKPKGENGVEIGTYTWNANTGIFTPTIKIGANESWGFHGTPPSLYVNRDTLFVIDADATRKTPKVSSATNPLIGSWGGTNPTSSSVIYITFMDDTHWVFAQGGSEYTVSGIQFGTYTWNSTTGVFEGAYIFEPAAEWGGFELESFNKMEIQNETLVLTYNGTVWRSVSKIK